MVKIVWFSNLNVSYMMKKPFILFQIKQDYNLKQNSFKNIYLKKMFSKTSTVIEKDVCILYLAALIIGVVGNSLNSCFWKTSYSG